MDDERLAAIEARAQAATKGDWFVDRGGDFHEPFWQIPDVLRDLYGRNSISSNDQATIEFIAASRTDVPDLVAAVRAERARADAAEAAIERVRALIARARAEHQAHDITPWVETLDLVDALDSPAGTETER